MRVQAYYLRFTAPVRSLPRAPTLLGHLLWWYRYTHGKEALEELLPSLPQRGFRLSSAFPEGFLPRPKLPPVQVEETTLRKRLKGLAFLSFETFREVAERGEEALLEAPEVKKGLEPPKGRLLRRFRVGIDRATGGAQKGILFAQELFFPEGRYAVYALDEPPFDLEEALRFVGEMGFGGLASVGAGTFRLEGKEAVELPEAQNPNAFASLAPGPLEGARFYELEPYWGRLGGGYVGAKPFKKPHLRTREGSVYGNKEAFLLLDVTPEDPPEAGVRVYEALQVFPLGVRV
ncbi:MAG: RAMP superfamily CRISPR-associated protein [Thermus sp.]|uniref:type III-A CRISPR-associated RAMP protein Csm4 n=1 Tax=Thermus sp. TaxID=275 RepID=UPI00351AB863